MFMLGEVPTRSSFSTASSSTLGRLPDAPLVSLCRPSVRRLCSRGGGPRAGREGLVPADGLGAVHADGERDGATWWCGFLLQPGGGGLHLPLAARRDQPPGESQPQICARGRRTRRVAR